MAGGWLAGTNAARLATGKDTLTLPGTTMAGALLAFISSASPRYFQPMPPNFGILPELERRIRKKRDRYAAYAARALQDLARWQAESSHTTEPDDPPGLDATAQPGAT